ncbi:MAG: FAD/NAD(P)-binding protein [Verrucomicrobiota bacterium]
MLDWLIVGGGPHGIHLGVCLIDRGVPLDRLAVLDPNAEPLARWSHHTENVGMSHLRSPEVHNLGVSPFSLGEHAHSNSFMATRREQGEEDSADEPDFIPPYSRPSLRLFMHHVQSLVEDSGLMRTWKLGRADSIHKIAGGYRVESEAGEKLEAKNVVLALGIGDQLALPSWATDFKARNRPSGIHHIFSSDFRREEIDRSDDVVIVGAGISAAQLALALLEINPKRRITIISRHFLKKEDFDSDPGWLGPTLLEKFHAEKDYEKRREMIREARIKGSLASEVMQHFQNAILHQGSIRWEMAEIERASEAQGQRVRLEIFPFELDEAEYGETGEISYRLGAKAQSLEADTVVLATGFEARRPGGALVDEAIERMGLPTAKDGFPIVDHHLRWQEGLFVMGPLAELEVGPVARNISGARMAAERIISSPAVERSVVKSPVSIQGHLFNPTAR